MVTHADYLTHWRHEPQPEAPRPTWDYMTERRKGVTDRRLMLHDRRWNSERGRRMRLADRRQWRWHELFK